MTDRIDTVKLRALAEAFANTPNMGTQSEFGTVLTAQTVLALLDRLAEVESSLEACTGDPLVYDEAKITCFFCGTVTASAGDGHAPDCPYVRARKVLGR